MKQTFTLWTLLTMLTLYSCKSGANYKEVVGALAKEQQAAKQQTADDKFEAQTERKIIKQGEISFETADVKKTKSFITKTVDDLGGYIAKDNIFDYKDRISHRLVIRVTCQ